MGVPEKAKKILTVILFGILLIGVRLWHLTVVQHETIIEKAKRPMKRVVLEPPNRGTIRDRFNIPLALNKVKYQAAIYYSQLRTIPTVIWKKDENGKKIKIYKRKEYIKKLSSLLGNILDIDAERLEDLIYSKAAFYFHLPYIIKDELTEEQYYQIKMLELNWVGIYAQKVPRRTYPHNKLASSILGYMGAINRQEYEKIIASIKSLEEAIKQREDGENPYLPEGFSCWEEVNLKLDALKKCAYSLNDTIGKSGIEARFEDQLRGFHGKRIYYADAKGNFLRKLPQSHQSVPGNRILLTISKELQEHAEKLLIQSEEIHKTRSATFENSQHSTDSEKNIWIKGGAIVAIDPNSGEVLALASYPRFDPNDFVTSKDLKVRKAKQERIKQWFETEDHLANLWDEKTPLTKEYFDLTTKEIKEKNMWITWDAYLDTILPKDHVVRKAIKKNNSIGKVCSIQKNVALALEKSKQEDLITLLNYLYHEDNHIAYGEPLSLAQRKHFQTHLGDQKEKVKKLLDPFLNDIKHNYDKVLFIDLCRLAVRGDNFPDATLHKTLNEHKQACSAWVVMQDQVKKVAKKHFHKLVFTPWRKNYGKAYLKEKRKEEKLLKTYAKPYLDYFDQKEKQAFEAYWNQNKTKLILTSVIGVQGPKDLVQDKLFAWHKDIANGKYDHEEWFVAYKKLHKAILGLKKTEAEAYINSLRGYKDLTRPLYGKYRYLRSDNKKQYEKHLATAFYPRYGFGFARSYAYQSPATQGSIFKLVTAYEALMQKWHKLPAFKKSWPNLNPFEFIDNAYKENNQWFVGMLIDGTKIPQFYKRGRLPRSYMKNIGKLDLIHAMVVSSNPYFSLLASEKIGGPFDVAKAANLFSFGKKTGIDLPGEYKGRLPDDLNENKSGLYTFAIGQHTLTVTPLQTAVMLSALANGGKVFKPKIIRLIAENGFTKNENKEFLYKEDLKLLGIDFPIFSSFHQTFPNCQIKWQPNEIQTKVQLPQPIRNTLIEAMRKVVVKSFEQQSWSLKNTYKNYREYIDTLDSIKPYLAGKTSTSESVENIDLDLKKGTNLYSHVWFGAISFDKELDKLPDEAFIAKDPFGNPELVVVVYLKYGSFGKNCAPIAAEIVKKWREIKQKNQ